jgi:SNF2 family DNA or RNA helicase
MGLGKTAQLVATMSQLSRRHGISGPFLVVAPLSTIGHWTRELGAWSDLRTLTLHGTAADRDVLLRHLWHAQPPPDADADADDADDAPRKGGTRRGGKRRGGGGSGGGLWFEVVVTTYETLLLEESVLRSVAW